MQRCDAHAHAAAGPPASKALYRGCAGRMWPSELQWQKAGVGAPDPRTTSRAGQPRDQSMRQSQCCRLITLAHLPTIQQLTTNNNK